MQEHQTETQTATPKKIWYKKLGEWRIKLLTQYPLLGWLLKASNYIIFGIIGAMFFGIWENKGWQIFQNQTSESDKYIAVVISDKSDESFTIPQEFRKGFGDEPDFKSLNSGQKIKYKKYDDLLSVEQAEIIAKQLISDPNCVLIIGNSTSTLTEVTLNTILNSKDSKPGFILPIATADNILDKAKDQDYNAIIRMMPNNEKQAFAINGFITKNFKTPKIAILVDEENLTYSKNLSQKISDKIINEKGSRGTVVLKKNYGNSNRFIDDYDRLVRNNQMPDIIIFVGISTNGSLLMEEINNLKINIPIIFTDGCTVNSLMNKSKSYPNYYYLSAVQKSIDESETPTYQPVGEDAKKLSRLIIDGIDGNITRESVSKFIMGIKDKKTEIMSNGKAGKYRFDEVGENLSIFWNVYHYQNNILIPEYESKQ